MKFEVHLHDPEGNDVLIATTTDLTEIPDSEDGTGDGKGGKGAMFKGMLGGEEDELEFYTTDPSKVEIDDGNWIVHASQYDVLDLDKLEVGKKYPAISSDDNQGQWSLSDDLDEKEIDYIIRVE
jgi:hypothetical protein